MSAAAEKLQGSMDLARAKVTERLVNAGKSKTKAAIAGLIAWFDDCFLTYDQVGELVGCHRETAGRLWRELVEEGYGDHQRVMPGQKPRAGRWKSSHGTTDKRIRYGKDKPIGIPQPMTRGDARRARQRQGRPPAPLGPTPDERLAPRGPKYVSAVAAVPMPDLDAVIAEATAAQERRWEAAELESLHESLQGVPRPERPPDSS